MAATAQIAPEVQAGTQFPAKRGRGDIHPPAHASRTGGIRTESVDGRFRLIPTTQLCLAWWLYSESHITKRQLRIFFAAHEMQDRRCFGDTDQTPIYRLSEILRLIGGRGSAKAQAAIRKDLRALKAIGLVKVSAHRIVFANSPEQITVADLATFWDMWSQIKNKRRKVPVPRRTLRALAGGFSKSVTGVMIAMLIRSLYVHRETDDFRIDGRTKRGWVASVMRLDLRRVAEARAHLTELGWLQPLEASQWQLNRWGAHDQINVDWQPVKENAGDGAGEKPASDDTESAPPTAQISTQSAPPYKEQDASPKEGENKKPRTLGGEPPDPSGFSISDYDPKTGSRKKSSGRQPSPRRSHRRERAPDAPADLRDVRAVDLRDTDALLELYRQAIASGLASNSTGGRIDFFAFAERARSRGERPGALFTWLLKGHRTAFITQTDEDGAAARLREHFHGPDQRKAGWQDRGPSTLGSFLSGGGGEEQALRAQLTEKERFVQACIQVGKAHRRDPFRIAREAKGWSRDQWDTALLTYRTNQTRRQTMIQAAD